MTERAYCRVYYSIKDDPKFDTIREDDHHLATWLRLLITADAIWPASPDLPASARKASVKALVAAELVDLLPGGRYRIRGLDNERGTRSDTARASVAHRTYNGRNTNVVQPEIRSEYSRSEPSQAEPRPSQAEPIGAGELDDALDAYYRLTTRYPSGRSRDWILELAGEFGHREVGKALGAMFLGDSDLRTIISRTEANLRSTAHHAELERAKPKPRPQTTPEEHTKRAKDRAALIREWSEQIKDVPA